MTPAIIALGVLIAAACAAVILSFGAGTGTRGLLTEPGLRRWWIGIAVGIAIAAAPFMF